jgi:hypothetical protein
LGSGLWALAFGKRKTLFTIQYALSKQSGFFAQEAQIASLRSQ